jgi:hypothetical protein
VDKTEKLPGKIVPPNNNNFGPIYHPRNQSIRWIKQRNYLEKLFRLTIIIFDPFTTPEISPFGG